MTMNPYELLCKLYGSEDVVRLRRKLYSTAETTAINKLLQIIPSGSRAEGLEMEGSDFDIMGLVKNFRVYESEVDIDRRDNNFSIIMETNCTKRGFTRLKTSDKGILSYQNTVLEDWIVKQGENYLSSALIREFDQDEDLTVHGPCQLRKTKMCEIEHLYCFRCKEWISIAQPWRRRARGTWPSYKLINDVTRYGVLFVPVGCKTSKNEDLEWRVSFSVAEKQLIHSFTHTQFLCYAMLKTVLSDIIKPKHGDLLCSYFIKTIMFWLSEEQDFELNTDRNVLPIYMACLKRLIYCVEYRICLHYFIPEINFFEDRFTDVEQKELLGTLYAVFTGGWESLFHTDTFLKFQKSSHYYDELKVSTIAPLFFIEPLMASCIEKQLFPFQGLKFISLTTLSTKRMILYAMALEGRSRITRGKPINTESGNKILYHQYKSALPDILISTRTDCVSSWCLMASLFYKLQLYDRCKDVVNTCLHKCTPEKVLLALNPLINMPVFVQGLVSNRRFFTSIMRHYFLGAVQMFSTSFLPIELTSVFISEKQITNVPPVVYLLFVDFLCDYHLNLDREKKIAFRNLEMAVRDRYFISNDHQIYIAEQILNVAIEMMKIS